MAEAMVADTESTRGDCAGRMVEAMAQELRARVATALVGCSMLWLGRIDPDAMLHILHPRDVGIPESELCKKAYKGLRKLSPGQACNCDRMFGPLRQ
eukprot:gene2869-3669_t